MTMMLLLTVMTPRTPATKEAEEGRGGGFQGEVSLKLGFKDREGHQHQRGERPHAGRGASGSKAHAARGADVNPEAPSAPSTCPTPRRGREPQTGRQDRQRLPEALRPFSSESAATAQVTACGAPDGTRLPQVATRLNFRPHPPDTSILAEMLIAGTGEKLLLKCNSPNRSDCLPVPQVPYRPS